MVFIIENKKYDTAKMRKVAVVRKWFPIDSIFLKNMFGDGVGKEESCDLYLSAKKQWVLIYNKEFDLPCAQIITQNEAASLLAKSDYRVYEEMFGEIENG